MVETDAAALGERVAAAREAAGLSQQELAARIDRSKSTMSRIESGDRGVNSLELGLIADAVGASVRRLLGEPVDQRPRLALAARLADAGKREHLDQVADRVRTLLELEDLMEQIGATAPSRRAQIDVNLPQRGSVLDRGYEAASSVREQLQLGSGPVSDLPGLIEEHFAVDVVLEPLPDEVSGLCVDLEERSLIVVNSRHVPGRQRFTLAHELCHHLWHDASYDDLLIVDRPGEDKSPSEKRCDAFAAGFLMPDDGLRARVGAGPVTDSVFVSLMIEFEVSATALAWRLLNLHLIASEESERFRSTSPRYLARRAGRSRDFEVLEQVVGRRRPPEYLEQQVIEAYERGQIGIGPVADLFGESDREKVRADLADDEVVPQFGSDLEEFLSSN